MSYKPIDSLDDIEELEGGETVDFIRPSKGIYMERGLVLHRNGNGHVLDKIRFMGDLNYADGRRELGIIQVNRSDLIPRDGSLLIRDRCTFEGPTEPSHEDLVMYSAHFID